MRVSDLIRAGGNLAEEAFTLSAELTRYTVDAGVLRQADVVEVSLEQILRGDEAANLELRPHDHLSITQIPEWRTDWSVTLDGEVMFPGEYRIRRGETLASVLERAGGLTEAAFPEGAVFLRDSLRERESEQVELLARRLESDLVSLSLQSVDTSGSETLQTGQALLEQLRSYEPVGRLVIDIETLRRGGINAAQTLELRDGDQLLVPQRSPVVTVIGEAQQNTSHLYQPGLSRDDYIELSGGLTRRADRKLIYVVKASGAVVTGGRSRWLGSGKQVSISPGDTIVVPLDTDRIRPLTFWTNVTQILYQGAIALAAVRTFSN
jgi:protein involved in polysaccharide export with SLBB domain